MPEDVKDFLALARERFKLAAEAEDEARTAALEDFRFRIGEQWPDYIRNKRNDPNNPRPCLTINRIPRTIAQVTNEQRQQRPAGQINPVGDGADKETADILQGAIRHIEVNSDAEIAYDMAFDHMVTGGFGYFRVITEYVSDDSEEQEILIRPIENPFTVYRDPYETYTRPADFYFVVKDYGKEEYKRDYPKSQAASLDDWTSVGNAAPGWAQKESIRVAEYFYVEETEGKNKRKPKRTVKWTLINGIEILDERDLPVDDDIPIFRVSGEELNVDGKKHVAGLVRHAKDSQRMYNFWVSAATEMIALAPKPKYIAAAGQVENFKSQWERANQSDLGVLTYDPMSAGGTTVPPPHLESYEPPVQAIAMMTKQSDNDFKSTTGIYDASLGEKGPDESGKAILARQKQTDIAILNFSDNLSRTIRKLCRYLLKLIPVIYSDRTLLRIIKPDGQTEMVPVNDAQLEQGMKKVYDIRTGRYDVVVSVGPSYQTKRQESVSTQLELAKSFPIVAQYAPDLIIRNMDIPQADEVADRVKMGLPPQILQAEDKYAIPQLQNQLAQAGKQVELLSKVNQELLEKVTSKQQELDAKFQIEKVRAEIDSATKIAVAEITTKAQNLRVRAELEQDFVAMGHEAAHELGLQAHDQAHERDMAQVQHQQALEQSQQGHEQALEQGQQSGAIQSAQSAQDASQQAELQPAGATK